MDLTSLEEKELDHAASMLRDASSEHRRYLFAGNSKAIVVVCTFLLGIDGNRLWWDAVFVVAPILFTSLAANWVKSYEKLVVHSHRLAYLERRLFPASRETFRSGVLDGAGFLDVVIVAPTR